MGKLISNSKGVFRFSLKESYSKLSEKPTEESLIMFHFSLDGKRFKKSTTYKCSLENWDVDKQRVKMGRHRTRNAPLVNKYLNELEEFSIEKLSEIKSESNGIDIDKLKREIGAYISGVSLVSESDEEMTLVKFSENTLKSKNRVIVKSTYRSYNQTLNLLKLFEEQNGFQLKFENMTAQFYRQFLNMLEDEDFNVNSMGKHIKNLKIFLNEAVSEGLMTNISYKKQFKILKKQTTQIYLNQEEIELLRDKDFSKQPKLEQARDLFLIGYYTGQRVSDYNGLNQNNIIKGEDGHSIKLKQQKTGYIFEMPLIKKIRDVMERHNNNFPDKMSEPVFRENLKTVARQTGLTKMIKVKSYEGRTEKAEEIPQYKLVKPHTARRSFCTNHYMARKPIQFIMAFSGHKTEKEFMNYIRVEQKVKIKTIVESGFFD